MPKPHWHRTDPDNKTTKLLKVQYRSAPARRTKDWPAQEMVSSILERALKWRPSEVGITAATEISEVRALRTMNVRGAQAARTWQSEEGRRNGNTISVVIGSAWRSAAWAHAA